MSFISPDFLIFFVVVSTLYFVSGRRWRWLLLLAASYLFYAYWNASYLILIIIPTLVSFFTGQWLEQTSVTPRRRLLLTGSLVINFGILFVFKYFNFFNESVAGLLNTVQLPYDPTLLNVLLPVGISFYTFQCVAYIIDVYRGDSEAETRLGLFALYVAFFPQLVAGPIERAGNMLPQFRQTFTFDEQRIVEGLRLVLWGVFKKVAIADRLAIYVNEVYNDIQDETGIILMIATVFFAIQIYCDFSGYSDIAIGTARILGFKLMDNFRQPYFSRSVREFWRRWHISLSTWFRDYLYFPLGGSRVTFSRHLFNLMVVFVVSGLWHGASWTFVIWGALHGIYVVIEVTASKLLPTRQQKNALLEFGGWALTFVLVCFAWIFFRANSLGDALYAINHLFIFDTESDITHAFGDALLPQRWEFALSLVLIGLLVLIDWVDSGRDIVVGMKRVPTIVRWGFYYLLAITVGISLWGRVEVAQEFIYFQF